MVKTLFIGLAVFLGPGVIRATYKAVSVHHFDAYAFVADANYALAPGVVVFLFVWAALLVIFLWLNVL